MTGADLPDPEQMAAMRGMLDAMRPKRDPLMVALLAVAATAFVTFLGWMAYETYSQHGKLAGLETGLGELKTAVVDLDETLGTLPATLQASLHDRLEPKIAASVQEAVATVMRGEIGALKAEISQVKTLVAWRPVAMQEMVSPKAWQAMFEGLNTRLEAVETAIKVRADTTPQ